MVISILQLYNVLEYVYIYSLVPQSPMNSVYRFLFLGNFYLVQ